MLSKSKFYLLAFAMLMLISLDVISQDKPLSPKETVEAEVGGAKVKIVYSRPSAKGRKMIGEKDPYGKVWRTGANESTTISFDKDVTIEGKQLAKGDYTLFSIPGESEWVIIINKAEKGMGAYGYNEKDDALRVTVKAQKAKSFVETFTIIPEKDQIALTWENFYVPFKVKAKK